MGMPMLLQEKMLAGVDYQIREMAAKGNFGFYVDDSKAIAMCFAPWDVAAVFELPTGDPTSAIDAYELKAVCHGHLYAIRPPDNDEWAADIELHAAVDVPLFSPLDVWRALQRKERADPGVQPLPLACDADCLLRNIRRGYESVWMRVKSLAQDSHDLFVLAAALADDDADAIVWRITKQLTVESVWLTRDYLEGDAAESYWENYSSTPLAKLRKVLGMATGHRKSFAAEWVSPSIIPLIELSPDFQDALQQPKWLLYKAVTICKGHLPEEQHNKMLAEALTDDAFAKGYLDFLKSLPAI